MRLAAALAAVALLAGCDLVKKVENRKILTAAVLASPTAVSPGGDTITSATTAQLFFGERQSDLSQPPTPLAASSATLSWDGAAAGAASLTAVTGKAGWYQASSGIAYAAGTRYTFKVVYQGEEFSGAVQAPSPSRITNADATTHVFEPGAYGGTSLTVTRDVSGGAADAIYAAFRSDDLAHATCDNAPFDDAGKFVQFVLDDAAWKVTSFVLPKSPCFPSLGTYAVTLTTVEKSTDVSSNLFLGSAVLAGSADVAVLTVQ